MSEIVLVTQNDEPALAFGEYEISADGNTMYVGSAGVGDGSSEVIYKGISPAQVKYGVFSRLQTIPNSFTFTPNINNNISGVFNKMVPTYNQGVTSSTNKNIEINEEVTRE